MRYLPLLGILSIVACTTRITPPVTGDRRAVLVDHGRHASLILERADGTLVRYAYGDWRFYAEGRDGVWNGLRALFWPTRAALGRQEFRSELAPEALRGHLPDGAEEILILRVPAPALERLEQELEILYWEETGARLENADYGLTFVPHPDSYWALNNSNQQVARWLRQLEVTVDGQGIWSRWELKEK
jgi:hypothetical protein